MELIEKIKSWQVKLKNERAMIAVDWFLDEAKQEKWRLNVLEWLSFVFFVAGAIGEPFSLYLYFSYPENQNWQFVVFLIDGAVWVILSIISWRSARAGKASQSLYFFVLSLWAGPTTFGCLFLEGMSRVFNFPVLILSTVPIVLLSPPEKISRRLNFVFSAWFVAIFMQYLAHDFLFPSPQLLNFLIILTILNTGSCLIIIAYQFYRLSLSGKIVLSVMVMVFFLYEAVLFYKNEFQLQLILDIVVGGVVVVTHSIAKYIAAPVEKLTQVAIQIRGGNMETQVYVTTIDEFGLLGVTFNKMIDTLRVTLEGLEDKVKERTRDLEIASDVSKQITQVMRLEELLPRLVEKTKEGFGLYFTSVYLFNEVDKQLLLSAGTGEAGVQMKMEGKAYDIEARPSLVAQAGREMKAVVIGDVTTSSSYNPNPLLPDTRSEAAIPMVARGELVGVLGVQSVKLNDFGEDDVRILTSLAEQIGVAVRNAQLYDEQVHVAEELKRVDRMKSQFLSSMSHELRTPLNAIINFIEMVAKGIMGPVNEEQEDVLNQSLEGSKHLLHLINDVLDISKIQAGKLTLFLEDDVNLHEEIQTVIDMVAGMKGEYPDVAFVQDIDPDLPKLCADRRRVRQILLNLLSNAFKFTENGSVTLSVKDLGSEVNFGVLDTGTGIPHEMRERIFEPFEQTVDGIKQVQGTGLGLPISKSLAEAHGGRLWVESEPGQGASFFFSLPVNQLIKNG